MSNANNQHERFYVSVGAAIFDPMTKKFLILKDVDKSGEYFKQFGPWELPGGRMHKDEQVLDALKREIKEETGITQIEMIGVVDADLAQLPYRDGVQGFLVTYLVFATQNDVEISAEHSEYRWMTLEEIEKNPDSKEWFKTRLHKVAHRIEELSYLTDLQRLQADFENYKKRQQAESKEFSAHLAKSIVTDLIPVLSNLQAAADHVPADLRESPWVMGITYIEKQFEDALRNYGVTPIEVKPGDLFNPTEHEAVDQQTKDGEESEHKIEKVVQKGYKMGERVIKAARVIVS